MKWLRWLVLVGLAGVGQAAQFQDSFANRELLDSLSGQLAGDNLTATAEPDEPRHAGKHPYRSLWVSWIAPTNGLATLSVESSTYDPIIAVYQVKPGDDPVLRRLERVEAGDDDRSATSPTLQFGVRAGQRYEIALDGYAGSTGAMVLKWNLEPFEALIPKITVESGDQSVSVGDTVTLRVALGPGADTKVRWFLNDEKIEEAEDTVLVIPNFQPANAGQYRARIEVEAVETYFFSDPIELQISSEGSITTLARNKFFDALESPLVGSAGPVPAGGVARAVRPAANPAGVVRGYNGSQIFHTVWAGRDVNEPLHCGQAGGASYWFAYQPPESGDLQLDTEGSAFDTVLEVYTYELPILGYQSLTSLACDDNGGTDGRTSKLKLAIDAGRTYLVVVDGVRGARGLAQLNYRLETNGQAVLTPPAFLATAQPVKAQQGTAAVLAVNLEGTPPLRIRWLRNGEEVTGATNSSLELAPLALAHAGTYSVIVTNGVGAITNPPVAVAVWTQPMVKQDAETGGAMLEFTGAGELSFLIESAARLAGADWVPMGAPSSGAGPVSIPLPSDAAAGFFRVRFE